MNYLEECSRLKDKFFPIFRGQKFDFLHYISPVERQLAGIEDGYYFWLFLTGLENIVDEDKKNVFKTMHALHLDREYRVGEVVQNMSPSLRPDMVRLRTTRAGFAHHSASTMRGRALG